MSKKRGWVNINLEVYPAEGDDSYVQYQFCYDYTNKEGFDFDKVVMDIHSSLPEALKEYEDGLEEYENE